MKERILTDEHIRSFSEYLKREEKSEATRDKYLRDIRKFRKDTGNACVTKELLSEWKHTLVEQGYAVRSVNSMLASVNSLLDMLGWGDCRVKNLRLQHQIYCAEDRELSKSEYLRLLEAAGTDEKMRLILQTICCTGIRVSELRFFTVEAMHCGEITVNCKGKSRVILIPRKLKNALLQYARRKGIRSGAIFLGQTGKPMDRSSIWRKMKQLCRKSGVKESKVYPHNLRRLFARTFYKADRDIAKLADVLGHSSINTTRIYIMSTGTEHRRRIERLGLVI